MKREMIRELFGKFEQACYVLKDVECWSARELQEIFNYAESSRKDYRLKKMWQR